MYHFLSLADEGRNEMPPDCRITSRCNLNFGLNVNTTQKNFSGSPRDVGNISGADKNGMGKLVLISPLTMIL